MIKLRPHQLEAAERLLACPARFSHAELCVSSGKSLVMAEIARRSIGRVLILAHTAELVKQNIGACLSLELHAVPCARTIGINVLSRVTVGTIQTIVRRLPLFSDVRTVIVDETHLVTPDEKSMYRRLFEFLPQATVKGVTGTPYRADGSGSLEESFGPCVFHFTFREALELGYVKPLRQIDAEADDIDIQGVKVSHGEWDSNELAHRGILLAPVHARAAVKALRGERRRRVLGFACDIEHAEILAREFNAVTGRRVAHAVHSKLDHADQERHIADFRAGNLPIMVSVQKFTTGFNVPEVDALIFFRPIRSRIYYVQSLGRGARKTEVALDCAVIDFGGNVARHGALDMLRPLAFRGPKTDAERDETQKKTTIICKKCGDQYADFFDSCPSCGYDPRTDRAVGSDLRLRSVAQEIISKAKLEPAWLDVKGPAVRTNNRHWKIPLLTGNAIWWPAHLPAAPVHVYARWTEKWGFVADGIIDPDGNFHAA